MGFAPQGRATFQHRKLKKWPVPMNLFTFLSCTCASRHSSVRFFEIETWKIAPSLRCFVHFPLQMCFAPQQRAIFRHRNFQTWSEPEVFLDIFTCKCASRHSSVPFFDIVTSKLGPNLRCFWICSLANVLPPTAACHFSSLCCSLPPHPPLQRAYFSNIRNHESLKKQSGSRLS